MSSVDFRGLRVSPSSSLQVLKVRFESLDEFAQIAFRELAGDLKG